MKGLSAQEPTEKIGLLQHVNALMGLLTKAYGPEELQAKAGRIGALHLMRSSQPEDRLAALEKVIGFDSPSQGELQARLDQLEEKITEILVRRKLEERLEAKITRRMQERQADYVKELTLEILREGNPDNAHTLKKYAYLQKLEARGLSRSALELMRPASLGEVVGQGQGIRSILSKLASPYPQHILIYGPPGVGKTTVARLALEHARQLAHTPFGPEAPFVEVDGTTIRWDPREATNPLLGSVHDPIYQGAKREMADGAIPEPKLGLVTEAHGGVLFIDEIGELEPILQNKLLKVLEDKRVTFESPYYDPEDPNIPKYIRHLFEKGAPADFVLIGATTRQPEEINPALRSRCAEVFLDPLTPRDIQAIVEAAAQRIQVSLEEDVAATIAQYTVEGRKAIGLLADAYGLALYKRTTRPVVITKAEIEEVVSTGRISPYVRIKGTGEPEVGKVLGLAVRGFLGTLLEIEAVAFPARKPGGGTIRFNETAGSMAKDSVFNAASLFRLLTGQELEDFDIHINVIGGAHVDGPSAGGAILTAIISATQGVAIRQDMAVTGEVSIRGKLKAVGGIPEKLYGARQAGIKRVVIPRENAVDVPANLQGVEVVPVESVREMLDRLLVTPLPLRKALN